MPRNHPALGTAKLSRLYRQPGLLEHNITKRTPALLHLWGFVQFKRWQNRRRVVGWLCWLFGIHQRLKSVHASPQSFNHRFTLPTARPRSCACLFCAAVCANVASLTFPCLVVRALVEFQRSSFASSLLDDEKWPTVCGMINT